jgi:hypothetical protein
MLLQYGAQMGERSIILSIRRGGFPWLQDALLRVKVCSGINLFVVAGLALCMIALAGPCCQRVAPFLADLSGEDRFTALRQIENKLCMLFSRAGTRRFFTQHPELITDERLNFARFIAQYDHISDEKYLELSRVCEVDQQLDLVQTFFERYLQSDKSDWI